MDQLSKNTNLSKRFKADWGIVYHILSNGHLGHIYEEKCMYKVCLQNETLKGNALFVHYKDMSLCRGGYDWNLGIHQQYCKLYFIHFIMFLQIKHKHTSTFFHKSF